MAPTKDTTIKELGGYVVGRIRTIPGGIDRTTRMVSSGVKEFFYSRVLDEYFIR